MSEKAFKIGPEYLNEALREAEINDITMSKTSRGQLHLDTKLSGVETVNRLISGLALLYSKLFTARDQLERQSSPMDADHPAFKVGPEYLNEVFREAEINDITMTKTSRGQLHMDTKLSGEETINRLVGGLALLYSKLFSLRSDSAHASSDDPTQSIDELFDGIADALGAEPPASITSELSATDNAALNNALRLVGASGVTYTLNTRGELLVPIADGSQVIVISPILLEGDEWLSMQVILRAHIPDEPSAQAEITAFCQETTKYYGAKCLPMRHSVRLTSDLPAAGLDTRTLIRAMRRLAWILDQCSEEISRLPGETPSNVFADRIPVDRSVVAAAQGIEDSRAHSTGADQAESLPRAGRERQFDSSGSEDAGDWPPDLPELQPPSQRPKPALAGLRYSNDIQWARLTEAQKVEILLRDPWWATRDELQQDPEGDRVYALVKERIRLMGDEESVAYLLRMPSDWARNAWLRMEPRPRRATLLREAVRRRQQLNEAETIDLLVPQLLWQREQWLRDVSESDRERLLNEARRQALALPDSDKVDILVAFERSMDRSWWLGDESQTNGERLLALADQRLLEQGLIRRWGQEDDEATSPTRRARRPLGRLRRHLKR